MNFLDDIHLDVCQNIETGLRTQYESHLDLTDNLCILGLGNSKIAIKQQYGYAKNEKVLTHPLIGGVVDWCVGIGIVRIPPVSGKMSRDLRFYKFRPSGGKWV